MDTRGFDEVRAVPFWFMASYDYKVETIKAIRSPLVSRKQNIWGLAAVKDIAESALKCLGFKGFKTRLVVLSEKSFTLNLGKF